MAAFKRRVREIQGIFALTRNIPVIQSDNIFLPFKAGVGDEDDRETDLLKNDGTHLYNEIHTFLYPVYKE